MKDLFKELYSINVNEYTEVKNTGTKDKPVNLTYLSWTYAVKAFSERVERWDYKVLPNEYDENLGYMVHTEITVGDETKEMWLPVMDGANKAMKDHPYNYKVKNYAFRYAKWNPDKQGYYDNYGNKQEEFIIKQVEPASMMDINKARMRCLVKNMAMFGLGLYIYAGEDLPETEYEVPKEAKVAPKEKEIAPKEKGTNKSTYNPAKDTGEIIDPDVQRYLEKQPKELIEGMLKFYSEATNQKIVKVADMTRSMGQDAVKVIGNGK